MDPNTDLDQNIHSENISLPQDADSSDRTKKINLMVSIIFIVFFILFAIIVYAYKNNQNSSKRSGVTDNDKYDEKLLVPSDIQVSTTPKSVVLDTVPKYVVYMHGGGIWFNDLRDNSVVKVSRTNPVGSPKLSPAGKYVVYFDLDHATGGFPVANVYIADITGSYEKLLGTSNSSSSRLTWSDNGDYIGLITFNSLNVSDTRTAFLYDALLGEKIAEIELKNNTDTQYFTTGQHYAADLKCSSIDQKYTVFCLKFQSVLNSVLVHSDGLYNSEHYEKSTYAKPDYRLNRSEQLGNGLLVLEYYTGEPQNPESEWDMGVFIPGYDKGVTDTYTVLIEEESGKVIKELPMAVDANFVFE